MHEKLIGRTFFASLALMGTISPTFGYAGPDTVIEIFGQWNHQCQFVTGNGDELAEKNCELTHQVRDANGQAVVTVILSAVGNNDIAASDGAIREPYVRTTIITPLGGNLQIDAGLSFENNEKVVSSWYGQLNTCIATGCYSDFAMSQDEVNLLKETNTLQVSFGMRNTSEIVELDLPILGLSEAVSSLTNDQE